MPITTRSNKGQPLTHAEMDANLSGLADGSLITAVESSVVNFAQSGSGAVAETVEQGLQRFVWGSQYGSQMTTTPAADINQAVTKVYDAGGGIVYLPYGTFQIETAILQKSGVKLRGMGVGATILQQKTGYNNDVIKNATSKSSKSVTSITQSAGTGTVTVTGHGYAADDIVFISGADQLEYVGVFEVLTVPTADTFTIKVSKDATSPATGTITCYESTDSDLSVEGLTILGASGATGGSGIEYDGVHRFLIKDVETRSTREHGISVLSGYKGEIINCGAHKVVTSTHVGILLGASGSPASYASGIDVIGCKASENGQDGILSEQGRDNRIMGCYTWRNGQSGIKNGKTQRLTIFGNTSWGNNTGINTQGPYANVSIVGNSCCLNNDSGILAGNLSTTITASGLVIANNVCDDNGQVGAATSYGVAIEGTASATLDSVVITGNVCRNQARGVSFGTSGTIANVFLSGNICKNNTVDLFAGASLQTTTLVKGFNLGTASSSTNALNYGHQIHRLHFSVENLAGSGTTVLTPQGTSARGFLMPEAGYARRLYVKGNDNVTAGSAIFRLLKNGSAMTSFNTTLNTTNPASNSATQTLFNQVFAAGDLLTADVVADASYSPSGSADYDVVIEVVY